MDEVSFALEERKSVVPVLYKPCDRPFRLRRFQYVDFTIDYGNGFSALIQVLPRGPESRDLGIGTAKPTRTEPPSEKAQTAKTGEQPSAQEQAFKQMSNAARPSFPPASASDELTDLEVGEERILRDTKPILGVVFSPRGDVLASCGGKKGLIFSSGLNETEDSLGSGLAV
jgi:hypothetical protein